MPALPCLDMTAPVEVVVDVLRERADAAMMRASVKVGAGCVNAGLAAAKFSSYELPSVTKWEASSRTLPEGVKVRINGRTLS